MLTELTQILAADESPAPSAGGGLMGTLPMILLMGALVVAFVFMNRRNKKQQAKTEDFRQSLETGQRVMTVGGMIGVISDVQGDVVTLRSANGDEAEYVRRAIRELVDNEMWTNMTQPYPTDDDLDNAEPAVDETETERPEPYESDDKDK